MLKDTLRQEIRQALTRCFGEMEEKTEVIVEYPADPAHGDYATPVALQWTKVLKKPPRQIAEALVEELRHLEFIQATEIAGPGFINFFIKPEYLIGNLRGILVKGEQYGHNGSGAGQRIMVEYSQPNTNKPMHIGHMRNNFLGMVVTRLLRANGYEAIPVNYVGDIGVHITKSMLGYLKWGRHTSPESLGISGDYFVGKYYQQFEAELAKDESLMEEAQEMVRKWEANDPETRKLWNQMNDWVYEGWTRSYERQGCHFEHWYYESTYNESGKEVAEEALTKGVAERAENGAIVAKLEAHGLPDKVIVRGDGTSIYATKDLKLAEESFAEYKLDGRVYVVASQQKLYLEQMFKILELMGYDYAKKCYHLAYGIVSLPEGMMSSRKGTVIYSNDLMDEVHGLAYEEVKSRHATESEEWLRETAENVMIGALKYAILKVDPLQDIMYDPKSTVKFEGDTGPYLQYTHARLCSILRKSGKSIEALTLATVEPETLHEPEELMILRKLQIYPELIHSAGAAYRVHLIASYLNELAQLMNSFYSKHPVLEGPSEELKTARLQLIAGVAQVIKNGLTLLGIHAPEKM